MENFIVSARKYRPATFDTVVGQTSITSTLKNAIKSNHLAQAFLFCGPRGVGKTTCARILAKTINCQSITQQIEACNECDSCLAANEESSLNVVELDGASNNSVEDIRNLIDQVRYTPQIGTHKVYIIDEVHMLSTAAFNAFLKTLEEPPKHAIFILATTEKHKIIPTILSRCQIFDFNRIQIDDISKHLSSIAKQENIVSEEDGLHIIAQKADGSLRDALSMFDQIVSFSGGSITYKDVIENLNILDYDYYFKISDAIFLGNISDALLIFNEILNNGFNGHNFTNGLAEHFRNLLVCLDEQTVCLLEVGLNIKERYKTQAKATNVHYLINFLSIINDADTKYKLSKNQRLLVEVMLMQLCSINNEQEKKTSIINLPISSSNKKESSKTTPSVPPKHPQSSAQTKSDTTLQSNDTQHYESQEIINEQPVNYQKYTSNQKVEKQEVKDNVPIATNNITVQTDLAHQSVSPNPKEAVKFSGDVSINQTVTTKKAENTNEYEIDASKSKLREQYSHEQFAKQWNNFKQLLLKKGKLSLASVFENVPEIENHIIKLSVENKVLFDDFKDNKTDFLAFIRKSLQNYEVDIEVNINEEVTHKKAYTPQEKFTNMSKKNPSLIKLVKKLDMDIGYA